MKERIDYWLGIAVSVKKALQMHQLCGQMEKNSEGRRSWGNVTEHCLVQVARTGIFGNWLQLPPDLIEDIKQASALHDFNKKQEINAIREADRLDNSPSKAIEKVVTEAKALLANHGFTRRIIDLASVQGSSPHILLGLKQILDKQFLTDEDLARLICHYVDNISNGSDWVSATEAGLNMVDTRLAIIKSKSVYTNRIKELTEKLQEEPYFQGLNIVDVMIMINHLIEKRLAKVIEERTGEKVDPLKIPEIVDERIKLNIDGSSTVIK